MITTGARLCGLPFPLKPPQAGRGPRVRIGTASSTTYLAEYFVLAALAPLGLVLWRRNLL